MVNMAGREVQVKHIVKSHVHHNDGSREVFFEVMGYPRSVNVLDKTAAKAPAAAHVKADSKNMKHLASPMPGVLVEYKVAEGDIVTKGQPLVIVSSMKIETVVVAPCGGRVQSIPLKDGDNVTAGDLLLLLV